MENSIKYINRKDGKTIEEITPGKAFLDFLYFHPLGKLPLHLLVKRKFLSALYGFLMNTSYSKKFIADFIKSNRIDMSEAQKRQAEYLSFNDFFYRKLKEGSRKPEEGVISPADGKILAFSDISDVHEFFIKGRKFTLAEFFRNDEIVCRYQNGSMAIIRLAPADYHRFHFPVSGKVTKSTKIKGSYLSVSPLAMQKSLEIFLENKREYCSIFSKKYGEVVYAEIGATMVGSIIQTYTPESIVKKGAEKGYFAFGGSSLLLLFKEGKITFSDDLLRNTKLGMETSVKVGESIGKRN